MDTAYFEIEGLGEIEVELVDHSADDGIVRTTGKWRCVNDTLLIADAIITAYQVGSDGSMACGYIRYDSPDDEIDLLCPVALGLS